MIRARFYQYLCDACDSPMMRYPVTGHPELERLVCNSHGCEKRHIKRYIKVAEIVEVDRRDSGTLDDG